MLPGIQLKHEIGWERSILRLTCSFRRLVMHAVKLGQIGVEHDLLATNQKNAGIPRALARQSKLSSLQASLPPLVCFNSTGAIQTCSPRNGKYLHGLHGWGHMGGQVLH